MRQEITDIILGAIDELNDQLDTKIPTDQGENTPLYGREGHLDSLGLVTLLTSVEQTLEEQYGVLMTIADEKALSQRNSPFRTVGTLADYIDGLLSREN